jgi:hypothetical protein
VPLSYAGIGNECSFLLLPQFYRSAPRHKKIAVGIPTLSLAIRKRKLSILEWLCHGHAKMLNFPFMMARLVLPYLYLKKKKKKIPLFIPHRGS